MLLGRVIGTVVATRKEDTLLGVKLLLVKGCDVYGTPSGAVVVAADAVGAGVGEVVLYAQSLGWPPVHIDELLRADALEVLADNGANARNKSAAAIPPGSGEPTPGASAGSIASRSIETPKPAVPREINS